jgi:hypothetical protein
LQNLQNCAQPPLAFVSDHRYVQRITFPTTHTEHDMADENIHTEAEIKAAAEGLLQWAKEHGGVLAVAAMFGDDDGPIAATRPEAVVAGALAHFNELEIAVLIAQLDVAVLLMLGQIAASAEMGEANFRKIVNRTRQQMLAEEGLDLCDDCGR